LVNGVLAEKGDVMTQERSSSGERKGLNVTLSVIQVLLALLFLFSGCMKFIIPLEEMTKQVALPGAFLRFIGVAEILGAMGLILPGALRIRTALTPLAASGLTVIVIGATVLMFENGGVAKAAFPFVTALLSAFVAYGRWRLVPLRDRSGVAAS
jgi:DoxX-like family